MIYSLHRLVLLWLCALVMCSCAGTPAAVAPTVPLASPPTSTAATLPTPTVPTVVPATPTSVPPTIAPSPSATPAPTYDLVLVGGTLLDGTGAPPLPEAAIAIRDGRIAAVGPAANVSFAPGTPTRDLRGQTVMPGFVNAHAHTDGLATDELKQWTRAGVTTVRDLGGPRDAMLARRAEVTASGDPALPRLLVAGPIITVPGGHPIAVYGPSDESLAVAGPEDAREQVNALIDGGANVIKIAVSGRTDVNWPELSNDEIRAIAETASSRGIRVAAHIDRANALRRAVENGIGDAAHMPRDHMPDDLIALMVERGVALVPTIDVYEGLAEARGAGDAWRRATLPVMQDNLRRFVAAGGTLALGDDFGNPGVALGMPMAEIRHWLAAGMTPMQVIVAATQGGARACGLADELGTLQAGKAADLLIVDGDLLTEIEALERVALVVHRGSIIGAKLVREVVSH
jgi:imidazolonepropionase-like amidohydrolase